MLSSRHSRSSSTIVEAKSNQLKHTVRDGLVAKLEVLHQRGVSLTGAIQAGLVESATAQVRAEVTSDAVKNAALEQASPQLPTPPLHPLVKTPLLRFTARLSLTLTLR